MTISGDNVLLKRHHDNPQRPFGHRDVPFGHRDVPLCAAY